MSQPGRLMARSPEFILHFTLPHAGGEVKEKLGGGPDAGHGLVSAPSWGRSHDAAEIGDRLLQALTT